jgi:general secretion pathway protein K
MALMLRGMMNHSAFVTGRIRQKGIALVLVLWMLSLMAIMAGGFSLSMRRQLAIVEQVKNNAEALALAEAGLAIAESMMMALDQTKRWRADGNVYQVDYANVNNGLEAKVRIRLLSESGKIDINKADQILLQSIMMHAPVDEDQQNALVGAIIDWRDSDDLVHIDGAEKKEYKSAGLSYQPRNKPFQSIEELQMVLGVNEDVYKWLEPLVTVHSKQGQADNQTASKEVLQVLPGVDASVVESFILARLDSARMGVPMPPFPGITDQGGSAAASHALTIIVEAKLSDGSSALLNALVTESSGNASASSPFQILKWQRSLYGKESLFSDEMSQLLVAEYAESEL